MGYWYDTITINKGEHDGVIVGMPAVIGDGLIGKVISTTTFNSTIRLITATDVVEKISVKIQTDDDYVYGILSIDKANIYRVKKRDRNKKIVLFIPNLSYVKNINDNFIKLAKAF